MKRRLSAIFAADMVGYSRLMEVDEIGTLQRQKAHRAELINPTLEEFHGRIVKEMGDGILVEFISVVEAVQCAVVIQQGMVNRETDVTDDLRISYRIGINLGDIIIEDDDIFGDGVNIAARLEQRAEPGGICISGTAYDHLKSKIEVGYESLGDVQVKNIKRVVRAYKILTDPDQVGETVGEKQAWLVISRQFATIAAILLIVIIGSGVWWWSLQPDIEPADPKKFAHKLPDKPSVAILPFDNLTSDLNNQYLADGFVETLITEMSQLADLFVIARNSSFSFRGKNVTVSQISESLGVRYVVEGSFQRLGRQLRINVQLVDAVTGFHIWSKRYDRPEADFYKLQDELIGDLVIMIGGRAGGGIFDAERRRLATLEPADISAIELWEKTAQIHFKYTKESNKETGVLSRELIKKAPEYSRGYVALAWHHLFKILLGISDKPADDLLSCTELAEKAIRLDGQDYMGYLAHAFCKGTDGKGKEASVSMQRAYDLNPGDVAVQQGYAMRVLVPKGKYAEAIKVLERIRRLNPVQESFVDGILGSIYLAVGDYPNSIKFLEHEKNQLPGFRSLLAVALHFAKQKAQAKLVIKEILKDNPNYSAEAFLAGTGLLSKAENNRFAKALVAAGLPEK